MEYSAYRNGRVHIQLFNSGEIVLFCVAVYSGKVPYELRLRVVKVWRSVNFSSSFSPILAFSSDSSEFHTSVRTMLVLLGGHIIICESW